MRVAERCNRDERSVRHASAGGAVASRVARYLDSGAKRSASGALRRVTERRSLRSPSARAHSGATMNGTIR